MQIWTLKTCNQAIMKIVIAMSFKLGQLIEDKEWIHWQNSKKKFFLSYCPLQIWPLKTITAGSLKLGQLREDDK